MCQSPIYVKNYNYQHPRSREPTFSLIHNTTESLIPVPCGRCASCIHLKQIYLVQRVQCEAISNDLFYGTLTYKNDMLPKAKFGDVEFAYPDYSDWQKMIKLIRSDYPDLEFKYMLVSEYGGKKHRPHFHFILSIPKQSDKLADKWSKAVELFDIFLRYWRRNVAVCWSKKKQKWIPNTRSPDWKSLCTYVRNSKGYNYDLHWLDPNSSKDGLDGVTFYVTKYILKYDPWVEKFKGFLYFNVCEQDYKDAWDKFRPRCLLSKNFGSPLDLNVQKHILKGIQFALDNHSAFFPFFISLNNGKTYPLAPYYARRFVRDCDKVVFALRRPDDKPLTVFDIDDFDKKQKQLQDMRSYLRSQSLSVDYDDIDNINSFNILDYDLTRNLEVGEEFADCWEDT